MAERSICKVPDCCKPVRARGWCGTHYVQWQRTGDPIPTRPRPTLKPRKSKTVIFVHEVALNHQAEDCLRWPFALSHGYPTMHYEDRFEGAHRVICRLSHGEAPTDRHQAAHSCGNKWCVNPRHLRWATQIENETDKLVHGTLRRGEEHYNSLLTEQDVRDIRALKGSLSHQKIADQYGVGHGCVVSIMRKESWAWLD